MESHSEMEGNGSSIGKRTLSDRGQKATRRKLFEKGIVERPRDALAAIARLGSDLVNVHKGTIIFCDITLPSDQRQTVLYGLIEATGGGVSDDKTDNLAMILTNPEGVFGEKVTVF